MTRRKLPEPVFTPKPGRLFEADCLDILPATGTGSVDTVFADPPFNPGKAYGRKARDDLPDKDYLALAPAAGCGTVRVFNPGSALFVCNLPKWNMSLGHFLIGKELEFRHWIAIEQKSSLPIPARLYPAQFISPRENRRGSSASARRSKSVGTAAESCTATAVIAAP